MVLAEQAAGGVATLGRGDDRRCLGRRGPLGGGSDDVGGIPEARATSLAAAQPAGAQALVQAEPAVVTLEQGGAAGVAAAVAGPATGVEQPAALAHAGAAALAAAQAAASADAVVAGAAAGAAALAAAQVAQTVARAVELAEQAVDRAGDLARIVIEVLGVMAVRDRRGVVRAAGVQIDGRHQPGNRVTILGPRGGRGQADRQQQRGHESGRERHPSPVSETHGQSLYRSVCPSWSVRNRASGGRVHAVLRVGTPAFSDGGRCDEASCDVRNLGLPWHGVRSYRVAPGRATPRLSPAGLTRGSWSGRGRAWPFPSLGRPGGLPGADAIASRHSASARQPCILERIPPGCLPTRRASGPAPRHATEGRQWYDARSGPVRSGDTRPGLIISRRPPWPAAP